MGGRSPASWFAMVSAERLENLLSGTGKWVFFGLLFQLIALVYWPSFSSPFFYDDIPSIIENADLRSPSPLTVLGKHDSSLQFDRRPVGGMVTWLNYKFSGVSPRGYHAANIVLHWLCAIVIWELCAFLAATTSARAPLVFSSLVTTLWAIHPLNSAAVGYIYQRMEILMALFAFLAVLAVLRAAGRSRDRWLVVAWLSALLSLLSKEVSVLLPLAMLLAERLYHFRSWRELLRVRMPFYASLFIVWLAAGIWFLGGARMEDLTVGGPLSTPLGYATAQCREVFTYFKLVVLPDPLIFYRAPEAAGPVNRWLPYGMGLVFIVTAIFTIGKSHRWVWLAGGLAATILLPTSSVIPLAIEPSAEFRMYLPSAPAIAVLLAGVWSLANRLEIPTFLLPIGICAVMAALGSITFERALVFSSRETLWADTVNKQPLNTKAWANLAGAQVDAGRYDQAGSSVSALERALGSSATSLEWLPRLKGAISLGKEDYEAAEGYYLTALERKDGIGALHAGLAEALAGQREFDQALAQIDLALTCDPLLPAAWRLKYEIFIERGNSKQATQIKQAAEQAGFGGIENWGGEPRKILHANQKDD